MLLDPRPPASTLLTILYSSCFGLLVVLACVWFFLKGEIKKTLSRLFTILMTVGLIGLIYTFVRSENLPYLSARIVLDVIVVVFFVWLVVEATIMTKTIAITTKVKSIESKYNKYLPKKKK